MSRRDDLLALLATRSAKRGTFTLASGRQSSLYIDARITTMSPDGLALIGPLGRILTRRFEQRRSHVGDRANQLRERTRRRAQGAMYAR